MKKFLISVFLLIAGWQTSTAQWVWAPLDSTTDLNSYFWDSRICEFCVPPYSEFEISKSTESIDQKGSFKFDYKIYCKDGWGGYVVKIHQTGMNELPFQHYDLSNGKFLSFWIKNLAPSTKTKPGKVNFEFKLKERQTEETGEDRWVFKMESFLDSAQNSWQQIIIPLEKEQFPPQSTDENGIWEPWNVYGWEIAIVYELDSTYHHPDTVLANGSFLLDKIQILGQRFEPVLTFDHQSDTTSNPVTKPAFWTVTLPEFDCGGTDCPGGKSFLNLSDEPADTVKGLGALLIDYSITGMKKPEGYGALEHTFDAPVSLSSAPQSTFQSLAFYLKTLEPNLLKNRFMLRIVLADEKDGIAEWWESVADAEFDSVTGWQYILLPLATTQKNSQDLRPGDKGFALLEKTNDGSLDLFHIKKIRLEFVIYGDENQPWGSEVKATGKFILDLMTGTGFEVFDVIPPDIIPSVMGLAVDTGLNYAIWEDVPGESGETYSVFYSEFPITSLNDKSVKVLATGIPEGTESVQHLFNYPTEKSVLKFWYAVLCSDKYGNTDSAYFGVSPEPAQNTARFVPLVQTESRLGFKADGSLSEWNQFHPWEMKSSLGTGTILTELGNHSGDQDLSAKIWINFSKDSLNIALHVVDDIVFTDSTTATNDQDAVDFFFGAYEYNGADHTSFRRGEKPDYHIRFNSTRVFNGQNGNTIDTQSSVEYEWKVDSDGYTLEWGISWADLASIYPGDNVFAIESHCSAGGCNVWPIPIDWVIYDADANGKRESGLRWGQNHLDNAWSNVASWTYTFSYLPWSEGVEGTEMPNQLTLHPNFPNPFNPETTIRYQLPVSGFVSLSLYDVTGREVKKLVNGFQPAGEKSVQLNGSGLSSGLYFLRLSQSGKSEFRKIVLLK